jgi:DNA polymerase-3 subunit alpha
MAAIMSRRRDQITEITKLMDECKAMGIATLGPDVNESYLKFGVNKKGEIRFGLAAIKGMGDNVAQAIIDEREKNGPYKSIFDFAQRINFSCVNRKAFESLALSGGFDSFGIPRENFFGENSKGEVFLDTLVRYGQVYQMEQQEMRNSLFGGENEVDIATPPIPEAPRWSDIERLNKERDYVGIYLSAHPLDEYKIVLNNLCNTRCAELADRCAAMTDRDDVTMGGIVTNVQTRIGKNNKPWGIITLEDFEGSGELMLFGDDWLNLNGKFLLGAAVYVTGKMAPRFQFSDQKELKVSNVELLQSVKEKAIDRITIMMTTDLLDDQIVMDLGELINSNPGRTKLYFQMADSTGKNHVLMRSTSKFVDVKSVLVNFIEQTPALDYKIN